jgi:hypothetical protein
MIRRGVWWYEASSCGRPLAQAGLTFTITACLFYRFDIPCRELSCHTQADFVCRQTIVTNFKLKVSMGGPTARRTSEKSMRFILNG